STGKQAARFPTAGETAIFDKTAANAVVNVTQNVQIATLIIRSNWPQTGAITIDRGVTLTIAPSKDDKGQFQQGAFQQSHGVITGKGTLDISATGQSTWTSGTMTGGGTTIIDAAASLSVMPAAANNVSLTNRTIKNLGGIFWSGNFYVQNGS